MDPPLKRIETCARRTLFKNCPKGTEPKSYGAQQPTAEGVLGGMSSTSRVPSARSRCMFTGFVGVLAMVLVASLGPAARGTVFGDPRPDASFGIKGSVTLPSPPFNLYSGVRAIGTDSAGDVFAAGATSGGFGLLRVRADGSPDSAFGEDGYVVARGPGIEARANSLNVQADGKLIAAGYGFDSVHGRLPVAVVARVDGQGNPDLGFGSGGTVKLGSGLTRSTATAADLDPKGRLIVAVRGRASAPSSQLLRVNANGSIDSSFGRGGHFSLPRRGNEAINVTDLEARSSGSTVFAGVLGHRVVVGSLDPSGHIDRSFGGGDGQVSIGLASPKVCVDLHCTYAQACRLTPVGSGFIVMAQAGGQYFSLIRLGRDGSLNGNFGRGGQVLREDRSAVTVGYDVATGRGGDIFVAGNLSTRNARPRFAVFGYTRSGRRDLDFGADGVYLGAPASLARAILVERSGDIVVGGTANGRVRLVRFTNDSKNRRISARSANQTGRQ